MVLVSIVFFLDGSFSFILMLIFACMILCSVLIEVFFKHEQEHGKKAYYVFCFMLLSVSSVNPGMKYADISRFCLKWVGKQLRNS